MSGEREPRYLAIRGRGPAWRYNYSQTMSTPRYHQYAHEDKTNRQLNNKIKPEDLSLIITVYKYQQWTDAT